MQLPKLHTRVRFPSPLQHKPRTEWPNLRVAQVRGLLGQDAGRTALPLFFWSRWAILCVVREKRMKFIKVAAGIGGLAAVLLSSAAATCAEVKLMAGNALAGVIRELGPGFEQATGHKILAQYGLS